MISLLLETEQNAIVKTFPTNHYRIIYGVLDTLKSIACLNRGDF